MMNGNSTLNGRWSENELATIKNVIQGGFTHSNEEGNLINFDSCIYVQDFWDIMRIVYNFPRIYFHNRITLNKLNFAKLSVK